MNDAVETFNVKNTSLRLVHIGGVSIPPNMVVALVNDPKGINKSDVDSSEYLEETDEEITWGSFAEEAKPEAPKKPTKTTVAKSATGASWSNKA